MEFVIWIIVIALIVAIIWWLVNRRGSARDGSVDGRLTASEDLPAGEREPSGGVMSSGNLASPSAEAAATADIPTTAGHGAASSSAPPVTPEDEHDAAVAYSAGAGNVAPENAGPRDATSSTPGADVERSAGEGDVDDWTTGTAAGPVASSLETAPAEAPAAGDSSVVNAGNAGEHTEDSRGSERQAAEARAGDQAEWESQWSDAEGNPTPPPSRADEHGLPQASTRPGAEPATAEAPGKIPESAAAPGQPGGGQPYGEGSALPGPDGSAPAGYTVKGDAAAMVYYDETDPGYGEATCNVWFLSPAHAEAAGFREPRRTRR